MPDEKAALARPLQSAERLQAAYFDKPENHFQHRGPCPPHVEEELREVLARIRSIPRGARVVDFGAGTGRLTKALLAAGYKVLAVDVSEVSLAALKMASRHLGYESEVSTSTHLSRDCEFDALAGCDILHHVEKETTIAQFRAAMKSGQLAVFSEPNGLNPAWYLFLTLFRARSWPVELGLLSCHVFRLRRLFERNGFAVTFTGWGLLPPPLFNRVPLLARLNYRLGRLPLLRIFAYRLLLQARRLEEDKKG